MDIKLPGRIKDEFRTVSIKYGRGYIRGYNKAIEACQKAVDDVMKECEHEYRKFKQCVRCNDTKPIDSPKAAMTHQEWFLTPNPLLGNISPVDMIKMGRYKKLCKWVFNQLDENGMLEAQPAVNTLSEIESLVDSIMPCNCIDAYKLRNLSAPDCPNCNYKDDLVEAIKSKLDSK